MKIGILTYPLNNNYGCYLQSYALRHFLVMKGYDVEYIYRRHNKPSLYFYIRYAISRFFKNLKNREWKSLLFNYEDAYMMKKGSLLYPFFCEYICTSRTPIYSTRRLRKECRKYDAIIVGSDQVWRAEILSNIEDYFLAFTKDNKLRRIAYAASFGKDNPGYTNKQIKKCGEAISIFDAVSVREESGREIIEKYGWDTKKIQVVIDPTMLLTAKDYMGLIKVKTEKEFVVGYILDQNAEKKYLLQEASDYFDVEPCNILENVANDSFVYPSVTDWLGLMQHAKFVLTDSFHGAVFSIIFNKPFAVVINKDRGASRFNTLLNTFGLNDRIISDQQDIKVISNSEIDWDNVNTILDKKRKEAEGFLMAGIKE